MLQHDLPTLGEVQIVRWVEAKKLVPWGALNLP